MQVEPIVFHQDTTRKKRLCCKSNEQDETILCNKKKAQVGNSNYYLTGMPPEMRKRTEVGT